MPITATKGNLIALKRSLELAQVGYELMDRKRNILIREVMQFMDEAEKLQKEIDTTFGSAYKALQSASITMGAVDRIATAVDEDEGVSLRFRSVMGVELPVVRYEEPADRRISYGLEESGPTLDEAFFCFKRAKMLTLELAKVENSIYRLAFAIKKTQKRANALKNIIIPGFKRDIKAINEALEEKEREEFTRLKVIKRRSEKQRQS